jgi:hypothetical protein
MRFVTIGRVPTSAGTWSGSHDRREGRGRVLYSTRFQHRNARRCRPQDAVGAQRPRWFGRGFDGTLQLCDTFDATQLDAGVQSLIARYGVITRRAALLMLGSSVIRVGGARGESPRNAPPLPGSDPGSGGPTAYVGPGRSYRTVQAAINSFNVGRGGTVLIDPGTYHDSFHVDRPVTIRPNGGAVTLDWMGRLALHNGEDGIRSDADFMIDASASGCSFTYCGALQQGGDYTRGIFVGRQNTQLILKNVTCHDCGDGILTAPNCRVFIYKSDFYHCSANDQTHPIYIGGGANALLYAHSCRFRMILSNGSRWGYDGGQYVKSRAPMNYLYNCEIGTQEGVTYPDGSGVVAGDIGGSRCIDACSGGNWVIEGGRWDKPSCAGQHQFFGYGAEDMTAGQYDITISGIQITNSQPNPLVANRAGNTNTITFQNCAFVGNKPRVDTGGHWGGGTWVGLPG